MQPGGMPDMQQILQQAQQMQQQLMSAQQELADSEVTGSAGGGLVTAAMSGGGELKSLTIDPKVVDPDDVETLADLVVAAVRDANSQASELASQKMGPLAGGLAAAASACPASDSRVADSVYEGAGPGPDRRVGQAAGGRAEERATHRVPPAGRRTGGL